MAKNKQEEKEYDGSTPLKSMQQELFVANIIAGINQSVAYQKVYKSCKNEKSAQEAASRMLSTNIKVKKRIEYKKQEISDISQIKVSYCQHELLQIAKEARKDKKYAAATGAIMGILRTIGGLKADEIPEANLTAKRLDAAKMRDLLEFSKDYYGQKYLADKPENEVIEAVNTVVLEDC